MINWLVIEQNVSLFKRSGFEQFEFQLVIKHGFAATQHNRIN